MITTPEIITEEERRACLPAGSILSKSRARNIVRARRIAMWRCHYERGMSSRKIAGAFNRRRNHSAVARAIRFVDESLQRDPSFLQQVFHRQHQGAPEPASRQLSTQKCTQTTTTIYTYFS